MDDEFTEKDALVKAVREEGGKAFSRASYDLQNSLDVAVTVVAIDPLICIKYIGEQLKQDVKFMSIIATINRGCLFPHIPEKMRSNPTVAKEYLCRRGENLEFAGENIKQDLESVREAVTQTMSALKFAGAEFQQGKNRAKLSLSNSLYQFQYLPEETRNNKEIVLYAINNGLRGSISENLVPFITNKKFSKDYDIIYGAVKKEPGLYFSDFNGLKKNKTIAELGMASYSFKFKHLPKSLQKDKELVLTYFRKRPYCDEFIDHFPSVFLDDFDVLVPAAKNTCKIFNLIEDKDTAIQLMQQSGCVPKLCISFSYGSKTDDNFQRWLADRDYVKTILSIKGASYSELISSKSDFANDPELIQIAITSWPKTISNVPEAFATLDLVKLAVSLDGNVLSHVPQKFQSNIEIIETAIHCTPSSIQFAKNLTRDLVIFSVKSSGKNYNLIHANFNLYLNDIEILKIALSTHPGAIVKAHDDIKNSKVQITQLIYEFPEIFHLCNQDFKDEKMCRFVLQKHPEFLCHTPIQILLDNHDIVYDACSRSSVACAAVPKELRNELPLVRCILDAGFSATWITSKLKIEASASRAKSARK